jgi:hypothetical protein
MMVPTSTLVMILVAITVIFFLINRYTRKRETERAEEYRKAASLRGWQLEFDHVQYRYSGTTEGVPWTLLVGHYRSHDRNRRPALWQTTSVRMNEGALIVLPDFGKGMEAFTTPGVPQFVLDLAMRPVASALAVPSADGAILAQALGGVGEGPEGFVVRGSDAGRLKEWLDNGAFHALSSEAEWLLDRESSNHLIIAVVWRHGLQIATPYGSNDLDHFARVARLGAKLAKAYGG